MNPTHDPAPGGKRTTTLAQVRAGAFGQIQQAVAMREEAADLRLRLWLERLYESRPYAGRAAALELALDAALSVALADLANVQLVHPGGHGLVMTAQRGFGQPFLDFFEFVEHRRTACGVALNERRSVVVPDIIRSPIFVHTDELQVMLEAGSRAVKSTPLIGRTGRLLGVLSVHHRQPRDHDDSDLTRLQTLAAAVSAMIDRD